MNPFFLMFSSLNGLIRIKGLLKNQPLKDIELNKGWTSLKLWLIAEVG